MSTSMLSSPLRYGVAVLSVTFALLLTLLLWPWMEPNRFLLLFVAVIFSSWCCRLGPGLLAALLATLSDLIFLPSAYPSAFSFDSSLRLGLLVLVSLLVGSLSSSRKQIEEERDAMLARERAARVEAEEANRSKDEFLAAVSHDLRTPLTSLLIWVRMLGSGKLDGATSAQALNTVASNVKSLAQLLDDLLDVSRIVSGKLRIETHPIELVPVIKAATNVVRASAEAKGITVETTFDHSVRHVMGDPDRLQQLLWNLLSNAIKFTGAGGRVQIRLEYTSSCAGITVRDTGCGIGAESLPHIFERSFQVERSEHRGLGLGLAIVKNLAELHNGAVRAESRGKGLGTTFTVELPLMAVQKVRDFGVRNPMLASGETTILNPQSQALEGLRILVVDDEVDSREVIAIRLEMCGAQVTEAASCAEALEAITACGNGKQPDVLVSDIMMPGEDGYTLIRKVRTLNEERGGQIPALALTAHARVEDRLRALEAGFHEHLPKPVEPAELVAVVARLAGQSGKTTKAIGLEAKA